MRPEVVVEVRYDKVQGQRFRHGTKLLRLRPDKDPAQCTWRELAAPTPAVRRRGSSRRLHTRGPNGLRGSIAGASCVPLRLARPAFHAMESRAAVCSSVSGVSVLTTLMRGWSHSRGPCNAAVARVHLRVAEAPEFPQASGGRMPQRNRSLVHRVADRVCDARARLDELAFPVTCREPAPGTMIHAVRADRHPCAIQFSQSRRHPDCPREPRRPARTKNDAVRSPLAQRFERHLDVGGIAVVEADPDRRARRRARRASQERHRRRSSTAPHPARAPALACRCRGSRCRGPAQTWSSSSGIAGQSNPAGPIRRASDTPLRQGTSFRRLVHLAPRTLSS